MRAAFKRRVRVIVPLLLVVGLLGLTLWLGAKLRRPPAAPPNGDASLLVLVKLTGPGGTIDRYRLVRVPFKGSEPQQPETVCETDPNFFSYHGKHHIIDGRYVVTTTGGVIDVWGKEVLRDSASELIEANSERVVFRDFHQSRRNGVFAFDLKTRKTTRIADLDEGTYGLSGKRSPDGTKSVVTNGSELVLHQLGHPPRELGEFLVEQSKYSSNAGNPPVLWLDNDRILTQNGNGRLIAVALDGTRTPVVQVPVDPEVIGAPTLRRDPDGRIIYWCSPDTYVIDVEARKGTPCEWTALGRGFEAQWTTHDTDPYAIRYRGAEIGRVGVWPYRTDHAAVTDGRIAAVFKNRVRVWSADTGKWTELDLRADLLLGWLK